MPSLGLGRKDIWAREVRYVIKDEGILKEEGLGVRLPAHRVQLTQAQQAELDAFLESLAQNP